MDRCYRDPEIEKLNLQTIQNYLSGESMKVSVIILNWNGKHFLGRCISSILSQTYKNIEIILVDNNSTDGSVEFVMKKFPKIKILKLNQNYGYAKANNLGAKTSSGKYLLFLNNDAWLKKDAIEILVRNIKNENADLCGLFQKNYNGKKNIGINYGIDIFGYPHGESFFYPDGCAFFIKKDVFKKLGGFDEKHFIFMEDVDLSWRARIFGYKIISIKNAIVFHKSGATVVGGRPEKKHETSIFRRYLTEKNIIRNLLKNYEKKFLFIILPFLFSFHIIEMFLFLFINPRVVSKVYLSAYWWNLKNIKDTLRERNRIQSSRKVSDIEIMRNMRFFYSKIDSFLTVGRPEVKK
jgi:GT2 family glycosyltransferase